MLTTLLIIGTLAIILPALAIILPAAVKVYRACRQSAHTPQTTHSRQSVDRQTADGRYII